MIKSETHQRDFVDNCDSWLVSALPRDHQEHTHTQVGLIPPCGKGARTVKPARADW